MIENLKCPNCGGPLDTAKTEGNIAVCPWCGNKLRCPAYQPESRTKKKDEEEDDDENFQLQYYRPQLTVEHLRPSASTYSTTIHSCPTIFSTR